ncbi:DrmE family protein [Robinsoniella peoriensis]
MDDITLSFDGGKTIIPVPPIDKVSIFMLDKMFETQGTRQIFVFPERKQTALVFVLARVIRNICSGKVEKDYTPEKFIPGEKLKLGNVVVEYLGVEEKAEKKYMILHFSNMDKHSAAISALPMFQKTDTKRPISSYEKYVSEKKRILTEYQSLEVGKIQANTLLEYKTHIASSIYYVGSVASVKEQMLSLRILGCKASDLLLIGQSNYEGEITNIGTGQLAGTPAIILSSDLYAVNSSLERGNPVQSIIVEVSNINLIISQLDVLDELLRKKVPIVFFTDTVNSFDFTMFSVRGFNTWRWNAESLTSELYDVTDSVADKRTGNCARHKLQYIIVDGNEISEAAKLLAKHRKESQEQPAPVMRLYDKLSNMSFSILRETIPLNDFECDLKLKYLETYCDILDGERMYLSEELFADYDKVLQNFTKVYSYGYALRKYKALCDVLHDNKNKKITMVIPEMTDKKRVESFWKLWIQQHILHINLTVCFPTEYYGAADNFSDMTVVVGWLRRAIMKKIIYSYNTQSYLILLYDYENRWKNYDLRKWSLSLGFSDNKDIIKCSLSDDHVEISLSQYEPKVVDSIEDIPDEDEQEEINLVLQANRYSQFVTRDSRRNGESVKAIPVNYVGGFLGFYQTGHKLLSATGIIMKGIEKIEAVLPEFLNIGDFIVVRESGKDLIKEMADVILTNNNKSYLRDLASKWREAIAIELLFINENEFFRKMSEAGCQKGSATIKNWIRDDDMIAPNDKEDLRCIADVTENEVLKELLDDVFDAAGIVRSAHIQAGRILSNQLKSRLVDVLKSFGDIDPFNFWEPIEIEVEDIGIVKVLKIIDKGNVVYVDSANTNRLIEG